MVRPTWDECFLEVAHVIAKRSTCLRVPSGVGCVLVSAEHTILSAGYAGSMRGAPHCTEVGCLLIDGGCKRTVHAEQNAIASAAANGVSLRGATAYVTLSPCRACAMMLHNAGVSRIVYATEYRIVDHLDELRGLGVDIPRPASALLAHETHADKTVVTPAVQAEQAFAEAHDTAVEEHGLALARPEAE